jgi:hypothetical protein
MSSSNLVLSTRPINLKSLAGEISCVACGRINRYLNCDERNFSSVDEISVPITAREFNADTAVVRFDGPLPSIP